MSTELEGNERQKHRVISIEKTDTPEGMSGNNWFRYVIAKGTSRIEGLRTGTLKGVTQHAEAYADELNLRGVRGYSASVTRKKT